MLLVLLLVSACSKNYPSNKYLGKLPMMAHDFGHIKTSERQKASILKKFNQEVALLLGTTLPCTIGKGTPLEVVEELKITEITLEGISYTGKLRFTKDIPATTGRITEAPEWDWCGNKHSQQFVIGLVMYSGDSIMCNLGCPTNTIIPYESLSQDNKNFIDYYFSIIEKRAFENEELYKWTQRKSLLNLSHVLSYNDADRIPIKNHDNVFDGVNLWDKGDTITVASVIPLTHWNEELSRFTSIKYTFAF